MLPTSDGGAKKTHSLVDRWPQTMGLISVSDFVETGYHSTVTMTSVRALERYLGSPLEVSSCEILPLLRGDVRGAMLYGSVARGDASLDSDIDVLQIARQPGRPYQVGLMSVTVYTAEHLRALAQSGSLFILHLELEGKVLSDPFGELRTALMELKHPPDYGVMKKAMRAASALLDIDKSTFLTNPPGFWRVGLYILRSLVYVCCAERGTPTFAISDVAHRLREPVLVDVFASKRDAQITYEQFLRVRDLVEKHVGCQTNNPFGSIEALAVRSYRGCPIVSALAARLLAGSAEIDYQCLPPDWSFR